jgi:hypothetical protein
MSNPVFVEPIDFLAQFRLDTAKYELSTVADELKMVRRELAQARLLGETESALRRAAELKIESQAAYIRQLERDLGINE